MPTVQQIYQRLSDMYPLPNMRDNTDKWRDIGCVGLITTDAVSIYQWSTEEQAIRWAGKTKDRAGPFVLSYAGSEQSFTAKEARKKMITEVRRMIADR